MSTGSSETKDINSAFLRAITKDSPEKPIVALMIDLRGAEIEITKEAVFTAALNVINGKDAMAFLDRYGTDVQITKETIRTAMWNKVFGIDTIKLLLDRCDMDVQIIQEITAQIERNDDQKRSLRTLLLDRCRADDQVLQMAILAIVYHLEHGMVEFSLSAIVKDVRITEELVIAYIESDRAIQMMSLLLEHRGADIPITKDVIRAIIEQRRGATPLLELFYEYKSHEMEERLNGDAEYNHQIEVLTPTLSRIRMDGKWKYLRRRS